MSIRFGIMLPIPTVEVRKIISIAKVNENAGFDSIWAPDHLLFIPEGITPNTLSILSALSVSTSRVILGICVSDPHRLHPAVTAQILATIDQLSNGRLIFGIGIGEAMNLTPFGISRDKRLAKLSEFIYIMRKLWKGEKFSYEGKYWKLKDAFLQIRPVKDRIPIYIGANKPKSLRLTGKIADGWIPGPLTPRLYEKYLKIVYEGIKDAGRKLDEIDTAIYLYTCISEDLDEVYNRLRQFRPLVISSPEKLIEAGYKVEIPEGLKSYYEILPYSEDLIKFKQYGNSIPDEALIEFSISGTVEQCIKKIEEYIKAGVKHFILVNVGPNIKQVIEIYSKQIIPYFKETYR